MQKKLNCYLMKNSYILFFIFLILGCSSKSNLETSVDEIKNQGKTILESNYILNNNFEINNIKKINLENNTEIVNSWNFPYYNSTNLIPHINLDNKFSIIKSKSYFKFNDESSQIRNILSTKDKLIYVDDYANLIILDHDLKLKKKIILNQKKIPKKYSAKFSLSIYENILYVSSNLGSLYAVDCQNYKILWSNNLGVPFISNIAVNSNSIFVSNVNGKLYSFDRYNGKQIWSYDTGSELFSDNDSFKILIHSDKLIFSNSFGYIYCIDLFKNTLLWSFKVPLSFYKYSENLVKFSNFIVDEEFFFFSTNLGKFYKINLNNGAVVWSNNSSFDNFFITIDNMIATTDINNFFTIYDKMSGKVLFKKNIFKYLDLNNTDTKNLQIQSLFLGSRKFFMITNTGYLVTIGVDNLNILNHIKISDKIISNLIILTNKIFLIDNKEYIYRIQ